jgi:aspartate/methionine/tyrosine aminotransferase
MMREAFARRGETMHQMLSAMSGVTCMEPQGAFYCFPNFSGLLGKDIGGHTSRTTMELADFLLTEIQIACVPGEAFGLPGYARFSFALGDADLADGMDRLSKLLLR